MSLFNRSCALSFVLAAMLSSCGSRESSHLSTHKEFLPPSHEATSSELEEALFLNSVSGAKNFAAPDYRPVPDTSQFSYVLFTDGGDLSDGEEAGELRQSIAKNLPSSIKLVVLTSTSSADTIRRKYQKWISNDRLILAEDSNSGSVDNGFWARDAYPLPVWKPETKESTLVSLKYYRNFTSGPAVAQSVQGKMLRFANKTFVGGNLLADEYGNCFVVASTRRFGLTENDFKEIYGCPNVVLLPHVAGIGDVDEVLKPLPNHRIITNEASYRSKLESLGYTVIMAPKASGGEFRTYLNTLIVENTLFLPVYNVKEDKLATDLYTGLGFDVIPFDSSYMSDAMHGSVHCQTMAYPALSKETLLKNLELQEL